MLLDASTVKNLRIHDITIGGITFVRAVDVVTRGPNTFTPALRNGRPLYALPGGGRATQPEIRNLLGE